MKKIAVLLVVLAFAVMGCHNLAGNLSPTETYVNSYEIAGAVAPMAKAYLARLEQNGTLTGARLADFKIYYAQGKGFFLQGGDILDAYIDAPTSSLIKNYPVLMQQFAVILADLTGAILVNADGKRMAGLADGKAIKGLRVRLDPMITPYGAGPNKLFGPEEVILTINLLLVAVDKVMGLMGAEETLTAEQKAAYHSRVAFTKKAVPDWF